MPLNFLLFGLAEIALKFNYPLDDESAGKNCPRPENKTPFAKKQPLSFATLLERARRLVFARNPEISPGFGVEQITH